MWTQFWDMNSGGGQKEEWDRIYIEASCEQEAEIIFSRRFGHNPNRVTCHCCGSDYAISSDESLENLTAYHRERGAVPLADYQKQSDVLFIHAADVKPEERIGEVPA
jgi:hypothetical protein